MLRASATRAAATSGVYVVSRGDRRGTSGGGGTGGGTRSVARPNAVRRSARLTRARVLIVDTCTCGDGDAPRAGDVFLSAGGPPGERLREAGRFAGRLVPAPAPAPSCMRVGDGDVRGDVLRRRSRFGSCVAIHVVSGLCWL